MRNRDILQRVCPLLRLLDIRCQPVRCIFYHGKSDRQFLHLLKCLLCRIQRLLRTVKRIRRGIPGRFRFHQRNLRTHDTSGLDTDRILNGNCIRNRLYGINTDFHICPLQRPICLTEGHINLRLDTLRFVDQVHHFTDQDISLLIHQIKSLERKSQGILGKDQISLGREGIWIHKIPPFIPS